MTREKIMKKGKCKYRQYLSRSKSTRCDLNGKGDVPKLHDICLNRRSICQIKSKLLLLLDNLSLKDPD